MDEPIVTPPVEETAPGEAATESAPVEKPEQVETQEVEAPKDNQAWAEQRVKLKAAEQRIAELEAKDTPAQPSAFETLRTPTQPVQPQGEEPALNWNQFGYVDPNQIRNEARTEAQTAAQEQFDEYKARQDFPDIFKDPDLEEIVASRWFTNKTRGVQTSIYGEAQKLANKWTKANSKGQQEAVKQALSEVTPKEAASLDSIGQTGAQARSEQSTEDLQNLRVQTRFGNNDAIVARLKNLDPL